MVGSEQLQDGQIIGRLRLLALVGQEYREVGCVIDRDTAHALFVETDLRVADLQRAGIKHGARVIDLRHTLVLPRILGRTTTGTEYKASRTHNLLVLECFNHLILHHAIVLVEVVVRKDIIDIHIFRIGGNPRAIDIHVQMTRRISGNGEAFRTVV